MAVECREEPGVVRESLRRDQAPHRGRPLAAAARRAASSRHDAGADRARVARCADLSRPGHGRPHRRELRRCALPPRPGFTRDDRRHGRRRPPCARAGPISARDPGVAQRRRRSARGCGRGGRRLRARECPRGRDAHRPGRDRGLRGRSPAPASDFARAGRDLGRSARQARRPARAGRSGGRGPRSARARARRRDHRHRAEHGYCDRHRGPASTAPRGAGGPLDRRQRHPRRHACRHLGSRGRLHRGLVARGARPRRLTGRARASAGSRACPAPPAAGAELSHGRTRGQPRGRA